jgi:hypothetical protein
LNYCRDILVFAAYHGGTTVGGCDRSRQPGVDRLRTTNRRRMPLRRRAERLRSTARRDVSYLALARWRTRQASASKFAPALVVRSSSSDADTEVPNRPRATATKPCHEPVAMPLGVGPAGLATPVEGREHTPTSPAGHLEGSDVAGSVMRSALLIYARTWPTSLSPALSD